MPPRLQSMPLDIRIRFGRAIRRIREAQGINQEEAAERCGLHRTYYSGIERGVRNVSLVNIEKVGKGLRTSLLPSCLSASKVCDNQATCAEGTDCRGESSWWRSTSGRSQGRMTGFPATTSHHRNRS